MPPKGFTSISVPTKLIVFIRKIVQNPNTPYATISNFVKEAIRENISKAKLDKSIILKGEGAVDCEAFFNNVNGDILLKQPGGASEADGFDRILLDKAQVDRLMVENITHRAAAMNIGEFAASKSATKPMED